MLRHNKSAVSMTFVCFSIAKLGCQISLGNYFLSLICPCMICLKEKIMQRKIKSKKIKNALKMIASVFSKRCGSYRMYLKSDSPYQVVMIVCELKSFSHISNRHNMSTLMKSCDIFHTQHTTFFATLDTCAGTMWFGHHKVLHALMYAY